MSRTMTVILVGGILAAGAAFGASDSGSAGGSKIKKDMTVQPAK